jgi:nucleotide-binding universal stress UspA family protein
MKVKAAALLERYSRFSLKSGAAAMSIKTMLVYVPSDKNAAAVLAPAVRIAAENGAHLIGFHLTPDLPIYGEFPAEISDEVIERLLKAGNDAASAAKAAFEDHVQAAGLSHEWRCFTASYGMGADLIVQHGHTADLIVCGKAAGDVPDAWPDFAEIAIMRSGRPVLLMPPNAESTKQIGKRAVIAWNDTREAARAVFDSLPLIKDAEIVRALTFIEKDSHRPAAEALGANLIDALSRHGIGATFDICYASAGVTGEAILSKLQEEGCDLLIMGGYSHSRFRELVFGGVSRDILRESWLPTLVSH